MAYLTQHFSIEEFTASAEATRRGIDNSLPENLRDAARETAQLLERVRDYLRHLCGREVPIVVTSGYRCLLLNRALGSDDTSHHVLAAAADFRAPAVGSPTEICKALASQVSLLGIGQLINEYPDRNGWVHISTRPVDKAVNRVITITGGGTVSGIHA
jgi:zinc D-Ala-D-Ala carboxypeptidase